VCCVCFVHWTDICSVFVTSFGATSKFQRLSFQFDHEGRFYLLWFQQLVFNKTQRSVWTQLCFILWIIQLLISVSITIISGSSDGPYWDRNRPPDGATAAGGPWPPLQYASRPLRSMASSSHLIFGLPLRLIAYDFPYIFFGIAVSCIPFIWPSRRILWHLINLTMFCPLIMALITGIEICSWII